MASYSKRGDSYIIRVSTGFDAQGNRIRKNMTWTPEPGMSSGQIKKELNRQMVLFENAVMAGDVGDNNITLKKFSEMWLRDYGKTQLKDTTYKNYERMLEDRIIPFLGALKLSQIRPQHILNFYRTLNAPETKNKNYCRSNSDLKKHMKEQHVTYERLCEKTGMSYNTIRHIVNGESVYKSSALKVAKALNIEYDQFFTDGKSDRKLSGATVLYYHHILSSMLNTAVQWQIIPNNPCERVKPPKAKRKEAIYLDEEDAIRLIECLDKTEFAYKALIITIIFTGMRKGEALGLTWKDIDFERRLIDINKELIYVHRVGVKIDTPKNETSIRVIKVPEIVMKTLSLWKEMQEENKKTFGDMYEDTGYVFTNKLGKSFHPDSISSWFGRFVKENDLPPIHVHSLRHTNASLMIANGVDIKTVSKRLGHSNVQTTGIIYTHQIRTADEAASEVLDLVLNKKGKEE